MLKNSRFVEMFGSPLTNEKKWPVKTWEEAITIVNGRNQKKVECDNGQYPICGSGGEMGRANDYLTRENSVIIGRKGNINHPILMKEKFWNVDTAFGLEPNSEMLNVDYLYEFCRQFDFERLNKTVTIPSLTKADLLKIEIPIPPLDLQNRYSEFKDQLDKLKVILEKIDVQIELLKKSRFVEMFGDIKTESKYKGIKIGDICETVSGGTPSSKNPEYYQGTIPWVTTVALGQNHIGNDSVNTYITEDAIKKSATHLIPSGSILFGTRVGVGKSSITDIDICTNQDIVSLVNIDETRFNKLFIKIAIDQYQSFFDSIKKGATIKGIRTEDLKNITIPDVPKSIQDNYESIVYQLDKLKVDMVSKLLHLV